MFVVVVVVVVVFVVFVISFDDSSFLMSIITDSCTVLPSVYSQLATSFRLILCLRRCHVSYVSYVLNLPILLFTGRYVYIWSTSM